MNINNLKEKIKEAIGNVKSVKVVGPNSSGKVFVVVKLEKENNTTNKEENRSEETKEIENSLNYLKIKVDRINFDKKVKNKPEKVIFDKELPIIRINKQLEEINVSIDDPNDIPNILFDLPLESLLSYTEEVIKTDSSKDVCCSSIENCSQDQKIDDIIKILEDTKPSQETQTRKNNSFRGASETALEKKLKYNRIITGHTVDQQNNAHEEYRKACKYYEQQYIIKRDLEHLPQRLLRIFKRKVISKYMKETPISFVYDDLGNLKIYEPDINSDDLISEDNIRSYVTESEIMLAYLMKHIVKKQKLKELKNKIVSFPKIILKSILGK